MLVWFFCLWLRVVGCRLVVFGCVFVCCLIILFLTFVACLLWVVVAVACCYLLFLGLCVVACLWVMFVINSVVRFHGCVYFNLCCDLLIGVDKFGEFLALGVWVVY